MIGFLELVGRVTLKKGDFDSVEKGGDQSSSAGKPRTEFEGAAERIGQLEWLVGWAPGNPALDSFGSQEGEPGSEPAGTDLLN